MTQKDENYLLQEICRNSGMGVAAINQVLKDVYDEEFAYETGITEQNRGCGGSHRKRK